MAALVVQGGTAATVPAPGATTGTASQVTSTSAVLHGIVTTHGLQTAWQFQYGTSTAYGTATPVTLIPAGQNVVAVTTSIGNLKPFTTYHYRLVAATGSGIYYHLNTVSGADRTFRTAGTGRLVLVSSAIPVSRSTKSLKVKFKCDSNLACKGKFSIVVRTRAAKSHKLATVVVTDGRTTGFSIGAHQTKTVTAKARSGAIALLVASRSHTLKGKLSSYPRTGQHALIKNVRLKLAK